MDQPDEEPMVARLRLGVLLRRYRDAAGLSLAEVAPGIGGSMSKISRMESGSVPSREHDVRKLLSLYKVTGDRERDQMIALARDSSRPGWWDAWDEPLPPHIKRALAIEAAATLITVYDPVAVPALLQTPQYAPTVSISGGIQPRPWRGGLNSSTMAHRQELISRAAESPRLWALIDESVLRRPPGGDAAVMSAQLAKLIRAASPGGRRTRVQIVPVGCPDTLAAAGPFCLLRFDESPPERPGQHLLPDIVLLEQQTTLAIIDRAREVASYSTVLHRIATQALGVAASLNLLQEIASRPARD